MFQQLLDIIFPRRCFACHAVGRYFCPECSAALARAGSNELGHLAAFDYDQPAIKKAIWKLKYSGITSLADELGALLAEHLLEEMTELALYAGRERVLVVPVPLSRARRRARGYNQSALLARALVRRVPDKLEYRDDLIFKIKDTPAQVSLSRRADRLSNLRGAFRATQLQLIAGRAVLIIDDVITTGATLSEMAKTLKTAGADPILTAALAHREI
jgi:ComF family protein